MSQFKGKDKPKVKKLTYTTDQVERLIEHNTHLIGELKKIRLPKEMTPEEFNDVVNHLKMVKIKFETVEELPELVEVTKA
jgi:hypothetical protein